MATDRKGGAARRGGASSLILLGAIGAGVYALTRTTSGQSSPPTSVGVSMNASMNTPTVQVGQYASATVTVINQSSSSVTMAITGQTTLNSTVEGNWVPQTVTVPAGSTKSVGMKTAVPIVAQFTGKTLEVKFTGTY